MPQPDPIPSPRGSALRRIWRILRLLAVFSIMIAAIGVLLVARGARQPPEHINLLIATTLGNGFTVLVGTGLMTLVFIGNSSGHDEAAADKFHEEIDKNDRP